MNETKICRRCKVEKPISGFPAKNITCRLCKDVRYIGKIKSQRPEAYIWLRLKKKATKFGIPFNIEVSDIIIPEFCPYLGAKLEFSNTGFHQPNSPSLDKIDPSKGYVKGNVEVISFKANFIKSDLTPEELARFARTILDRV